MEWLYHDNRHTIIGCGFVLPVVLLLIIGVNLNTGYAWLPTRYTRFALVSMGQWGFWGAVLVKLGRAVGFFGWYVLGNLRDLDRFAKPVVILGLLIAIVGVLAVSMHWQFVWWHALHWE